MFPPHYAPKNGNAPESFLRHLKFAVHRNTPKTHFMPLKSKARGKCGEIYPSLEAHFPISPRETIFNPFAVRSSLNCRFCEKPSPHSSATMETLARFRLSTNCIMGECSTASGFPPVFASTSARSSYAARRSSSTDIFRKSSMSFGL